MALGEYGGLAGSIVLMLWSLEGGIGSGVLGGAMVLGPCCLEYNGLSGSLALLLLLLFLLLLLLPLLLLHRCLYSR